MPALPVTTASIRSVGLQEIKRLRAETGAGLSECKQALESTSSFEDAVTFARRAESVRVQAKQAGANELESGSNERPAALGSGQSGAWASRASIAPHTVA